MKLRQILVPTQEDGLLDIVEKSWPSSWKELRDKAIEDEEFADLDQTLERLENQYGGYYPLKKDLFRAFHLTPLREVLVVMLAQDPYPQVNPYNGRPKSQGLCFSQDRSDDVSSSMQTVYTELKRQYPDYKVPSHADLTSWTRQGVLMLNSSLTYHPGLPKTGEKDTRIKIWYGFLGLVFDLLADKRPNCIYMLVGEAAQEASLRKRIGSKSIVLTAPHPSGRNTGKNTFVGCGHFKRINEELVSLGEKPIDWQI